MLPTFSRDLIDRHRLRFEILRDEGNEIANQYGLRYALPDYLIQTYRELGIDLEASNGDASWTLPLPARYILDSGGVIRHARVNTDYRFRPEPSETVQALRRVADSP